MLPPGMWAAVVSLSALLTVSRSGFACPCEGLPGPVSRWGGERKPPHQAGTPLMVESEQGSGLATGGVCRSRLRPPPRPQPAAHSRAARDAAGARSRPVQGQRCASQPRPSTPAALALRNSSRPQTARPGAPPLTFTRHRSRAMRTPAGGPRPAATPQRPAPRPPPPARGRRCGCGRSRLYGAPPNNQRAPLLPHLLRQPGGPLASRSSARRARGARGSPLHRVSRAELTAEPPASEWVASENRAPRWGLPHLRPDRSIQAIRLTGPAAWLRPLPRGAHHARPLASTHEQRRAIRPSIAEPLPRPVQTGAHAPQCGPASAPQCNEVRLVRPVPTKPSFRGNDP